MLTNPLHPFRFICEIIRDPDILKSNNAPKNSDWVEGSGSGETDLAMSNWLNISHSDSYLYWIFEVIGRLHEAIKAISLLGGDRQDEKFF